MRALVIAAAFSASFLPLFATAQTVTSVSGVQVITGDDAAAARPHLTHAKRPLIRKAAKHRTAPAPGARTRYGDAIARRAVSYIGTPYVWGGQSPAGFDCSGYVWYVYATAGMRIPRTADAQFAAGRPIAGDPEPGDLVFFQTYDYGASHVGIYLGNGWFVQEIAPNVHLSNFNAPYFRSRYIGARRLVPA